MSVMDRFRTEVDGAVRSALSKMGVDSEFSIEIPSTDAADLAVPCFLMSKALKRAPKDIAEELASNIEPSGLISDVSALNGYLNFKMDGVKLTEGTLKDVLEMKDRYGSLPNKGVKVIVEHTSTNPTGPIHVGRARNPIIGDTLARILDMCGYDVSTEYYVNDVGKQVVILTWGVNNLTKEQVEKEIEDRGMQDDRDKIDHKLVAYYRLANKMMEEDPAVQEEIGSMLRKFEAGDEEVISTVRKTAEIMLNGLKETLANIDVVLDTYTWESKFIADGSARKYVEELKQSKYAGVEDDGACYLELKDFGIQGKNTRFTFTRADGTTLYTTRDIAYHQDKFKRADKLIDVLGEDQKLGNKQLCCALEILGQTRKLDAMFYSFVSLPEGKMSTRKGVVVYLDDLIDEAVSRAYDEIRSRRDDMPEDRMREIAKIIGVGAIRYNIVRVQPEKQLVFKWEEALSFDGNSGPFLQYSYARACSMLRKAGDFEEVVDPSLLTDPFELSLIKTISKFESVIEQAGENRRIHLLPAYGHELASAFNQFYASVPVLNSKAEKDARLTLVKCSKIVLKNVLDCLGLGAPEEM
ncbi:MAG: arginine--tRNA ligase [Candidatus Methanarcanum hacksteinii]|uniref:arginine--tRNA ligase n=1 Tax=Candidatus Methanarcanum hacksteinii TaxID=2911857 RepID=UPI002A890726|nr:arginine--tRNA ligase [Candidatus Methanarcanum hacksteinii]